MMKAIVLALALVSLGPAVWSAETDGQQVVASAGGHNLTVNDIALAVGLAWFLTNQMPTEEEIEAIAGAEIEEFKADPTAFREGADQVAQLLSQARQYSNPLELGLYRMHVLNVIWGFLEELPAADWGYVLRYAFDRNPVLAYDRDNAMVFTAADGYGAARYLMFVNGNTDPTAEQLATIEPTVKALAENYVALPAQVKQQLAIATLMWQMVTAYWPQLTAEQQQQLLAQLQQQQQTAVAQQPNEVPAGTYQNMDAESLRILSEISQMQHVTSMNILENIGGTGDYWEVVEQPW